MQRPVRKPRRLQKRKKALPPGERPGSRYTRRMGSKAPRGIKHARGGTTPTEYERWVPRTSDVLARHGHPTMGTNRLVRQRLAANIGKRLGPVAEKAIEAYGATGARALNSLKTAEDRKIAAQLIVENSPSTANAIAQYGQPAFKLIKEHGNFAGVAIASHGPKAMELIERYGKEAANAIGLFGKPMLEAVSVEGENALWALRKAREEKHMNIPQIEAALKKGPHAFVNSILHG